MAVKALQKLLDKKPKVTQGREVLGQRQRAKDRSIR